MKNCLRCLRSKSPVCHYDLKRLLTIGSQLGPYEIVAPLGAGGMGEVWRARDHRLHRDVAVKVLSAIMTGRESALERFQREARLVAALSHPNIMAIHDFGNESGVVYAVMELLEGATLRDRLKESSPALTRTLEWAQQIAERSEEHTSELQSPCNLVCRLLLEKKNTSSPVRRKVMPG